MSSPDKRKLLAWIVRQGGVCSDLLVAKAFSWTLPVATDNLVTLVETGDLQRDPVGWIYRVPALAGGKDQ